MSTAAPAFVTYVINMDSATERMAHMDAELKRVDISYIRQPGVVGMELPYPNENFSDWSYKYLHGRRWAPRELGCYLSHIQCLRNFLQTAAPYALILEDDVKLDDNIKEILESAIEHASDWNMLRLSSVNHGKWWPVRKIGSHSLSVCLTREKGAGGYLVDKKAAACMVKKLLPMRLAWDIAFDLEWFLGFRTLGIYPFLVEQNVEFETQIQQDLHRIKKVSKFVYFVVLPVRLFLELSRIFYRATMYLFIINFRKK
jgi:glycosyl transferase family 25